MAGPGNFIPDAISANRNKPAISTSQTEPVWPEGGLEGLAPTTYPDFATNPSIDNRIMLHNLDTVARKHWWDKPEAPFFPDGEGNGPGSSQPGYTPKFPSPGTAENK